MELSVFTGGAPSSSENNTTDIEQGGIAPVSDLDCAICLAGSDTLTSPLCETACKHHFCQDCLGAYAIKRPAGAVPCPLCRAALGAEDIPSSLIVTLTKAAESGNLGLTVGSSARGGYIGEGGPPPAAARVLLVVPGSAADAAGLRAGMKVLEVEGSGVQNADDVRARLARHQGERVELRVGPLRPTPADVAAAAHAAGVQHFAYHQGRGGESNDTNQFACLLAFCCCCNITGQLWARAYRKGRWACILIALVLWFFFITLAVADWLSNNLSSGWLTLGLNRTGYERESVFNEVTLPIFPPRDSDLSNGVDTVGVRATRTYTHFRHPYTPVLTRVLLSVSVFCRRWHGSSPPLSRARCCSVAGLSAAPSSTARAIASSATSPSRGRGPLMAAWTTALRIASSGRSATAAASRRGCSARSRRPAPVLGTIIRCGCRSRTRRHVPQTVRGEERRTMRRRKSSACEAALCERRVRCGKEATVCSSFLGVYRANMRVRR